ncbi:MAG TPA: hypothetical protein VNU95_01825 [Candidatus Acidoferrales bacterium]|jgi:hypothetical protein|nr:hypothetical protein [Candidatus Acidoferrales bacterium]
MNSYGTIAVLASAVALTTANLYAELTVVGTVTSPYSLIATRNVFGLNPPSVPSSQQQDSTPPPKITLTGITTIIGPLEVLFKVAGGNRGGKQWQGGAYILEEGQEEDGVGVVAIDVSKGIVIFNNHGVRQDVTLSNKLSEGEIPFAAGRMIAPSGALSPKPGDYNYVDQKSVTAPLPPNENPGSAMDAPSMTYGGGIGGDVPPGHSGF